jgi:hypothetical protein
MAGVSDCFELACFSYFFLLSMRSRSVKDAVTRDPCDVVVDADKMLFFSNLFVSFPSFCFFKKSHDEMG